MDTRPEARQPVKVTIYNQTYSLVSQGEPADIIAVAREVDQLMHSIGEKIGSSDPSRVAVLACMHLADRLRALEDMKQKLNHRAEEFATMLEQVLEEAS